MEYPYYVIVIGDYVHPKLKLYAQAQTEYEIWSKWCAMPRHIIRTHTRQIWEIGSPEEERAYLG